MKLLIGRWVALVVCAIGIPLLFYMLSRADDDPGLTIMGMVISVIATVVAAVSLVAGIIILRSTKYTITNQRILIEKGLFSKSVGEIDMRLIDDSQFAQNFFHRLLGIGQVTVMSSDKNSPEFVLQGVSDPRAIRELIRTHSYQASQRQLFTRPT